ncbi:MAG: hypothetical protein KKD56_11175 [Acidobacteria bacterium]|nr:hypothetical protein [Acidobacteriota bacterium]MBU1339614.1 hypothetical protein [Acidobacteriota bacterium]MBU1474311.1 hypothetical protein [Acidobacteriota bacterium]MBU2437969.1 hypothetical protein [Acidobacteriota bacterium]MBU4203360.1 hypothetical protein [Acidobacteriota bacterium]
MKKSIKFAISMPHAQFKALESCRRLSGQTRSAFILEAVRARLRRDEKTKNQGQQANVVSEDSSGYRAGVSKPELPEPQSLMASDDIRKRAMAAAGSFQSEDGNLSMKHDEVFAEGLKE